MPALAIYNPPNRRKLRIKTFVGQIADNVHKIKYEHHDNGKLYQHDFNFAPGVEAYAVECNDGSRGVLLIGRNKQHIWDDL